MKHECTIVHTAVSFRGIHENILGAEAEGHPKHDVHVCRERAPSCAGGIGETLQHLHATATQAPNAISTPQRLRERRQFLFSFFLPSRF